MLTHLRLAGSLAVLGAMLAYSPVAFAQVNSQSNKPAENANTQDGSPALSHDLSGVWMQYRDGDVPGTPGMNGVNERFRPPLTPWGQAQVNAAKPLSGAKAVAGKEDNSALRCEPSGPPQVLVLPNPWEIVQIPGRVLMFFEEQHVWREIWTDGRPLPKDATPQWNGYSIARWEGDTLVVESSGFNGKAWLDYAGHPTTESLQVIERFQRHDFGHMDVTATITDPGAYTKPWSYTQSLTLVVDDELMEEVCENRKDLEHIRARK